MLKNPSNLRAMTKRSRYVIATLAAVGAISACMFVSAASPLRHDSTPEATIRGMFDAFKRNDWRAAVSRIEGAKVDQAVAALEKITKGQTIPNFNIKIDSLKVDGDQATGEVGIDISGQGARREKQIVFLHRVDGDWKITRGGGTKGFFDEMVTLARDPSVMVTARKAAKATIVLANMKQIALAAIMLAADYNDVLKVNQPNLKAKLLPYLKNNQVWQDGDRKPLNVQVNPALAGKSLSKIKEPARTVMLSVGSRGNLEFVEGKTPIAFADGHVKYYTKTNIGTLLWK